MDNNIGQFISDVRNALKATNKDDYISSRFIYSMALDVTKLMISQRKIRDIYRDTSIHTTIQCLEMKKQRKKSCPIIEFKNCDEVMVSKQRLPEFFNSTLGQSLISVYSLDVGTEYQILHTITEFKNNQRRRFGKNKSYAYIHDGHLYIVGSSPRTVTLVGIFTNPKEAEVLSTCGECDECKSILDYRLPIPNKYVSLVKDAVLERLLPSRQLPEDENPDLDSNQKTRKQ